MRPPARTFEDLEVWQKAHAFVLVVYRSTKQFPTDERFGLIPQFRRAAFSVPANIAEGFRRRSPAEKARFFNIAESSLEECRYYCILSRDLGYPEVEHWQDTINEIMRLLAAYISKVKPPAS